MKAREVIGVAIVIFGIVAAAALVVGVAFFLLSHGHAAAGVTVLLGCPALAGLVWSAFALTREREPQWPARVELRRRAS